MPAPQRTARIEDEIWDPAQARAKAEGASLGALMRAAVHRYASGDLTSNAEPASQPPVLPASQGTPALVIAMTDAEPSPGTLCMGPGCLERSTSRYGLRRMPLCPACRAALEGRTYQREIPAGAARAIRHPGPNRKPSPAPLSCDHKRTPLPNGAV